MNDKEKILNKIKKCMALGESANENEAAAALRQARKLMDKHGVTESHVGLAEYGEQQTDIGYRRFPGWVTALAAVVGTAFQCSAYTSWRSVDYVGRKENTVIAGYCLEVLLRQLKRARKDFVKSLPSYGRYGASIKKENADAFCEGWVSGVASKVRQFAAPLTSEEKKRHSQYLTDVKETKVKEPKARKYASESSSSALAAAQLGYRAGKDVQLHHGMGQDSVESLALEARTP
ncbi:MAG: hypothetical protein COB05_05355 [Marinobacter sp.]|nr:MAG: hypothetical protein COB05_05355 [Marinobacter sp.]